ncbi:MAG TPA: hypothetical protein VNQ77_06980 [Frankiaceae bacterium]|nr:hypothetical protein [Frankiaceae bacterium]
MLIEYQEAVPLVAAPGTLIVVLTYRSFRAWLNDRRHERHVALLKENGVGVTPESLAVLELAHRGRRAVGRFTAAASPAPTEDALRAPPAGEPTEGAERERGLRIPVPFRS